MERVSPLRYNATFFLTSLLVRTLAWVIILQKHGVLNQLLIGTGIAERPLSLLYTRGAVYLGMIHILLPFMVLPIRNSMQRIPPSHMKAALSLGATPLRAFLNVYLPATLPGIGAGVLIVGVLTLGFYITPEFLGDPRTRWSAISSHSSPTEVSTGAWHRQWGYGYWSWRSRL